MLHHADPSALAYYPPVSGGVLKVEAQKAAGVAALRVTSGKKRERLRLYQRRVSRENHHIIKIPPPALGKLRRVAGALLFTLPYYLRAGKIIPRPPLHRRALKTDHNGDILKAGALRRSQRIIEDWFFKHQM
ncbi:hypothetical protein SDC9_156972 [bioreactor metagenome]|uniref:Uncharacterized protein n=1 Tax=bioreactor metagenome TaxID=1076179 RepID=A0A645F719_9ZZZZ